MLRYRMPMGMSNVSAQVNVENVFDRSYVDRGGIGGSVAKYGSPRGFIASVRVDF
jgi:outer membrane receptor protein involved in Fe transport